MLTVQITRDAQRILGADARLCANRSLFFDRFSSPELKEEERRGWFEALLSKPADRTGLKRITANDSLHQTIHSSVRYAQLKSRLMVNMAGTAMENAGLGMDRFGAPYIPGSAVKGCARRMAIENLREEGLQLEALTDGITKAAYIFGWSESDWSNQKRDGRAISDFAYAVGDAEWAQVKEASLARLPKAKDFGGLVSFLPASAIDAAGMGLPAEVPAWGTLELDVITCHHPEYHRGKRTAATDDEDPNPVLFPAVAAGHVFAFAIAPMRGCPGGLLEQALTWLVDGLSLFGIGVKTAAGYGWFDTSEETHASVAKALADRISSEEKRRQHEAETAEKKRREEAEQQKREEMKAALASLSPHEQEDYKLGQLTTDQFRSALENYLDRNIEEQKAFVRALRLNADAQGSRRAFWEELKKKAAKKGGKWGRIEHAIRQLSKQLYSGKEGKMP